jgi:hypothetical protein
VARGIKYRRLAIALRVLSWTVPTACFIFLAAVGDELPRISWMLYLLVSPSPGFGFASTSIAIGHNLIRGGLLQWSKLWLWCWVPLTALASVITQILLYIAVRRELRARSASLESDR